MSGRPASLRRLHPAGVPARNRLRRRLDRVVRGRTVLVVGARRAGNHAVIGWLANALVGAEVPLEYPDWRVGFTADRRVLHCNDLPGSPGSLRYGDLDRAVRRVLDDRRVDDLVLSYEDVRIADLHGPVLLRTPVDARVLVTRPLLDLVASRLTRARAPGRSDPQGSFGCTQAWLDVLAHNRSARPADWVEVPFDRWLTEPALRRAVLDRLGLTFDAVPHEVAPLGGGSSFEGHRRVPDPGDLTARRDRIDWDAPLVALLLAPRNRTLLGDDEVAFLEARSGG